MGKKKKPKPKSRQKKDWFESYADGTSKWARDTTVGGLKESRTLEEIAREVPKIALTLLDEAREEMPPQRLLACKEGCSWCCMQTVLVNATEVLSIASHIRSTFTPEELAALKDRLVSLEERIRGMSSEIRKTAQLPCALLVDGRCSVYSVRPLACAGYNSYDASVCERATNGLETQIPWYGLQVATFLQVGEGVKQGLGKMGLSGADLELTAALRIALEDPKAAEKFLAKVPVFQDAKAKAYH